MKLVEKLGSECLLVLLIIVSSLGISIFPTLYHLWKTPPGTQFSLASNYFSDYYEYLGWMKDGQNGHLDTTTRFTSEHFPSRYAFTYTIYPILGMIGPKIGLSLFSTYTIARVLFGGVRILAIYYLIRLIFHDKKRRILALMMTVFLPGFLRISLSGNQLHGGFFLSGITNFDVLTRNTFIPHHLLSHIFNIIFFIFFYKALKEDRSRLSHDSISGPTTRVSHTTIHLRMGPLARVTRLNIYVVRNLGRLKFSLAAALFLFLASVVNPATLSYMMFLFPIAFIILWLVHFRGKFRRLLLHFIISALALTAAAIYYKFYYFTVFPWDYFIQSIKGESRFWNMTSNPQWSILEYLGALGPTLILSFIAILDKKIRKNILLILLFSWAIGPLIGFLFLHYIMHSLQLTFRIFQSQQFVPLGILASAGIFYIHDRFKKRFTVIIISALVLASLPYYIFSFKSQIDQITASNYFVYLPLDSVKTFKFLDQNTPSESVVLAGFYMAQLMPAYTHNKVYLGRDDLTYDYTQKLIRFTDFFSNKMNEEEAKEFLRNGHISYVYLGPDTSKPPDALVSKLENARLIFQSGDNYIYQVMAASR